MKQIKFLLCAIIAMLMSCFAHADEALTKAEADKLHTILEAARTTYATDIVNRLQDQEKVIRATENWKEQKTLLLPAQFFRATAERSMKANPDLKIQLMSLWPIEPTNGPKTDAELKGLTFVKDNPTKAYYTYEMIEGKKYFTAVYADNAVTNACVSCHNYHPKSPKGDFKLNDVMGGVVIRILQK